jgi:hypothetical protein
MLSLSMGASDEQNIHSGIYLMIADVNVTRSNKSKKPCLAEDHRWMLRRLSWAHKE